MTDATRAGAFQRRLILFGRYPVPGETKTRLIPALGAYGAADLHRRLAEKSLATTMAMGDAGVRTAFAYSGASHGQVRRWLGPGSFQLMPQKGHDLGARMRNAIFSAFDQGDQHVVLVGTDIPHMAPRHLESAFDALLRNDVVLGPSRDGGYWLVGLKRKTDIFSGIEWGGADVLNRTLAAVEALGLSAACIDTLNDMDTPTDLAAELPDELGQGRYLSVIVPTLNEAAYIGATLERIQSQACELIVSDGGSRDRTRQIARANGAKVVIGARGRAEQQNAGAAVATGRVLLFLHADVMPPPDYVDQVFGALMEHGVAAGAFQFRTDYNHPGMRLIERAVRMRSRLLQMPYGDQALFMARRLFQQVGGFPPVPIAEDLYLVRRLGQVGRIVLASGAVTVSGRRWREVGIWRTTLINYLVAAGCMAGIDPGKLAPLYQFWVKSEK